jgi:Ca2+-binding RTX toxin-like protein
MSTFIATAAAENFTGTAFTFDTVSYVSDPSGVVVDVVGGGSAGFAAGDTYSEIDRYRLSNLADTFIGSALGEVVLGQGGYNTMDGAGGDDTLKGGNDGNMITGGVGADLMYGGSGADMFVLAAGDTQAGEFIKAYGGTDSIVLTSGGTGSIFDLTLIDYFGVEAIQFDGSVAGTLIVEDNADQAITSGTTATGEVVHVQSWVGGDDDIDAIYTDIMTYLGNDIDAVEWTRSTGDVSASICGVTGCLQVEYTNNGPVARNYDTLTNFYDGSIALEEQIQILDNGIEIFADYDASGGPGNEILLTQTYFDGSVDGSAADYQFLFRDYGTDGVLDSTFEVRDDGMEISTIYTGGNIDFRTRIDAGDAVNFDVQTWAYHSNGELAQKLTTFDLGETFASTDYQYDTSGNLTLRNLQKQDGTGKIDGSSIGQTIWTSTTDEKITGGGGADTFVFSGDTGTDTIFDFDVTDDLLDLTAYGVDSIADLGAALSFAGGKYTIDVDQLGGDTGDIVLANMTSGSLTDANFVDVII